MHQVPSTAASSAARSFLLVLRMPPRSRKGLLFVPPLHVSLPVTLAVGLSLSGTEETPESPVPETSVPETPVPAKPVPMVNLFVYGSFFF